MHKRLCLLVKFREVEVFAVINALKPLVKLHGVQTTGSASL